MSLHLLSSRPAVQSQRQCMLSMTSSTGIQALEQSTGHHESSRQMTDAHVGMAGREWSAPLWFPVKAGHWIQLLNEPQQGC